MSVLLHWFTSPEWAQVVKALLHSLWQGALLAVALALVLRRVSNPITRYRCSLAGLIAIIFATIVTWAIINAASHRPATSALDSMLAVQTPALDSAATPLRDVAPATVVLVGHQTTTIRWTAWLAFAWLAGAILMMARAGIKVAGAEQLRHSCQPLSDARIEALLAETRRALGIANRIRVGVTDKLTSPAVVGIVVPMLILPLALLTTLTPEQIRFVLLHELAHIRRRDYLANLFQFFAESLLFFNPAVWWISHQIRREREACCDALATELSGAPGDYAQTLVRVAENILYPAPAAAPAFGDKREPSTLAERIQRLLVPGYRPSLRLTWRAMLAALVSGSILLFLSAVGTRLTVAAILTPQQRIDVIEKKMAEYGQKPERETTFQNPEKVSVMARVRTADGSSPPGRIVATMFSLGGTAHNSTSTIDSVRVEKDGTISNQIVRGEIWVKAEADGFAPVVAGPFDASDTNRLDVGELVLNRGFDVTIRVTDAVSGKPLPNAALRTQFWIRGAGSTVQEPGDLKTDSNGEATLRHCADQPLTIAVNALGHEIADQRFEDVHPGETLDLILNPGAQIAGIVTDKTTGQPISGANVRIIYQKGPTTSHYEWNDPIRLLATTGGDGRFVANELQPATIYWLGVSAPEHQSIILSNLLSGERDVNAALGPELIVRGQVLGDVKREQWIDNHYALYRRWSEVFDGNSWGVGAWVPLEDVNGVMRFEFTNRTAGTAQLVDENGRIFERQADAPIDNWVIDLNEVQKTAAVSNVPRREVIFRFKDPSGAPLTRGTVSVQVPDDVDPRNRTAHMEDREITNGEVHAQIPIGGSTAVEPKQMIGYWFSRFGLHGELNSIDVSNGPGPIVIDVPTLPAGAIYAKARNADSSPAGGLLFGVEEVKRAPNRSENVPFTSNDTSYDNAPRKWVSGPLPLGGTYRVTGWRGNSFCASKPVKLTEENPIAEVELEFPPAKTFEGVVRDANSQPVPNAELQVLFTLSKNNSFNLKPVFTDEKGHFRIEDASPGVGEYVIEVHEPKMMAVREQLDFETPLKTIRLERGRRIAGCVTEAETGNILPGAEVRAVVLDNFKIPALTTHTDGNGHFEFSELSAANYTLFLNCGAPASQQTYRGNVDTNITLAVKLYSWSTVKPVPPASWSKTDDATGFRWYSTNFVTHEEQIEIAQLVQDGKLMFQLGKMDEAEAKLTEALKGDPNNQAALYYLRIVKEHRGETNGNAPGRLPKPNLYARSNIIYTLPQRQKIYQKLNDITFDHIAFPNLQLSEVVRILNEETKRRDPDKEGVKLIIQRPRPIDTEGPVRDLATPTFDPTTGQPIPSATPTEQIDLSTVRISLDPGLKNVRLMDVLDAVCSTADHPIRYSLLDYGVEFSLRPELPDLFTRTFKVDPNVLYESLQNVGGTSNDATSTNSGSLRYGSTHIDIQTAVINFFAAIGVRLSSPKSVYFNDRQGTLTVRATADDLDAIEGCLPPVTATQKNDVAPIGSPQTPVLSQSRTNLIYTSPHRQKTMDELKTITLDRVLYPGVSLSEVLRNLTHEVELRDPNHEGINFILNRTRPIAPQTEDAAAHSRAWTNDLDLGDVKINLDPGLKNVRLVDVLEAIAKTADHPIQYSVLDYGVEFYFHPFADPPKLLTRTFKIDPSRLLTRLGHQTPLDMRAQSPQAIQSAIFQAFTNAGFNLAPPRHIFFVPEENYLIIRSTANELDAVEKLVSQANGLPSSPTDNTASNQTSQASGQNVSSDDIAEAMRDGKLLFQLGKMDEAEAKLTDALNRDPDNQAALYYLHIIKKTRAQNEINSTNRAQNLPNPNLYAPSNIIYTSPQRQKIYQKLNDITFEHIAFPNLQLSEVVRILNEETKRRDPDKEGITFLISKATNEIDLSTVQISLDPGLKNVRLMDVLDVICSTADHPIKYSMLDYGVEFSLKGSERPELFTRTFKVDPSTFYTGLQNVGAISFGKTAQSGDSSGSNGNPSNSISHVNVTGGAAAAAASNRGIRYVSGLDPESELQTAVINFFYAIGVNLAPPKSVFFNDRQGTLTVHASADDLDLIEAAVNTLKVSLPEVRIKARFVEVPPDSNWPQKFDWYPKALPTNADQVVAAILTEPVFEVVLNALKQSAGADLIYEREVTALSGRPASFELSNTNKSWTGSTLDVVPYVDDDGSTIQTTLIPTITELVGYDQSGAFVLLPHIRLRLITTSYPVKDGQTFVLGRFPSEPGKIQTPNLLIFVTPTLTNAPDYRIHPKYHFDSPIL